MADSLYLSEIFKVIEGAVRLDPEKVRNYSLLLADKLESSGDTASARRLRRLLEDPGGQIRPLRLEQSPPPPVDSESRFPLLERIKPSDWAIPVVLSEQQTNIVDEFTQAVKHRVALENQGLRSTPSLLLYGPPGCGKTHLAIDIARRLDLPIFVARLDGLISSFLGSTAKNIRAIFEFAARTPCVLFVDEFDAIAKVRDDQQELGELKRVVNSFIQTLDALSRDLIVIAATNHERLLDGAVWRRFSFQLEMPFPNPEGRKRLWTDYLPSGSWTKRDIAILSDLSDGFSGASIQAACDRLKTRLVTHQEQPNLNLAVRAAVSHMPAFRQGISLNFELMTKPEELFSVLSQRAPELYSIGIVSEIAGVPKSTLARRLHSAGSLKLNPA